MITGSYSKERKQESNLGEVIAGAVIAIVKALKQSPEKRRQQLLPLQ